MTVFIYKIRKTGLLQISDKEREEDEFLEKELLYRIQDGDLKQIVQDLRPYQSLWTLPGIFFKPSSDVISYFERGGYTIPQNISMVEMSKEEVTRELERIRQLAGILEENKVFKVNPDRLEKSKTIYRRSLDNIKYRCDLQNYLSDIYGEKISNVLSEFEDLSVGKQELVLALKNHTTREKQMEFLKLKGIDKYGPDFIDVLRFLPEWYRVKYTINGLETKKATGSNPECSMPGVLGKTDSEIQKETEETLRDLIYKDFLPGNTYSGEQITKWLEKTYSTLGINKASKICDFLEYFEYKKVNLKPRISEYKLTSRK